MYSHKAINETCTDNHSEHHLQNRLHIPTLSSSRLDVEVTKLNNGFSRRDVAADHCSQRPTRRCRRLLDLIMNSNRYVEHTTNLSQPTDIFTLRLKPAISCRTGIGRCWVFGKQKEVPLPQPEPYTPKVIFSRHTYASI